MAKRGGGSFRRLVTFSALSARRRLYAVAVPLLFELLAPQSRFQSAAFRATIGDRGEAAVKRIERLIRVHDLGRVGRRRDTGGGHRGLFLVAVPLDRGGAHRG